MKTTTPLYYLSAIENETTQIGGCKTSVKTKRKIILKNETTDAYLRKFLKRKIEHTKCRKISIRNQ